MRPARGCAALKQRERYGRRQQGSHAATAAAARTHGRDLRIGDGHERTRTGNGYSHETGKARHTRQDRPRRRSGVGHEGGGPPPRTSLN